MAASAGAFTRAWRSKPRGEWYSEYNIDLLGVEAAEFEGWSALLLGKVYLLTDWFQPYALAGGGYLDVELSDKLGLGLSENSTGSVVRWGEASTSTRPSSPELSAPNSSR